MSAKNAVQTRVPEFFFTSVRKVEPVGGDCIRVYCAIERNGTWEDRFTVLMPIASALASSQFVMESATEIFNESQLMNTKVRAH